MVDFVNVFDYEVAARAKLPQMIYEQNHQGFWDRLFAPRTSLDSLNKHSAVLNLVNQTTVPDDIQHHNVVGIRKGRSVADGTDGVVKANSAHRDDVDSEIFVRAKHSDIHRHPDTIAEVRRILLEHLDSVRLRRFPVTPIQHSPATTTDAHAAAVLAP